MWVFAVEVPKIKAQVDLQWMLVIVPIDLINVVMIARRRVTCKAMVIPMMRISDIMMMAHGGVICRTMVEVWWPMIVVVATIHSGAPLFKHDVTVRMKAAFLLLSWLFSLFI